MLQIARDLPKKRELKCVFLTLLPLWNWAQIISSILNNSTQSTMHQCGEFYGEEFKVSIELEDVEAQSASKARTALLSKLNLR
jgi:hypothetical protein